MDPTQILGILRLLFVLPRQRRLRDMQLVGTEQQGTAARVARAN
jgi:hypothetical protein